MSHVLTSVSLIVIAAELFGITCLILLLSVSVYSASVLWLHAKVKAY